MLPNPQYFFIRLEMKMRQTEMRNECAKFLLSAYRPNGADARDPVFKEALEQVQRDPVLARWFREQRDFDEMISAKLRLVEPPAGLETVTFVAGTSGRIYKNRVPRDSLPKAFSLCDSIPNGLHKTEWNFRLDLPQLEDVFELVVI
jgi:hypothetical protein